MQPEHLLDGNSELPGYSSLGIIVSLSFLSIICDLIDVNKGSTKAWHECALLTYPIYIKSVSSSFVVKALAKDKMWMAQIGER